MIQVTTDQAKDKLPDLIDAASRIYDINPYLPQLNLDQWQSTESLEMEIERDELGPMA